MGRLPKYKVDKSIEMLKQGFTSKEVAEKVQCSESTVSRTKKRMETKPTVIDSVASLVGTEAIKTIYRILEILNLQSGCDEDLIQLVVTQLGRDLTEELMKIDPQLAKRILKETCFYEYQIEPILTSKRDEEDIPRQEWINLLRRFWPEKLAELIK